jgi:hypothetical protein
MHAEEGQAKRSGQAERSEEGGLGGGSPDYGNPTRTHAEEGQANRSGQAKRSEEGGSGGSPDYGNPNRTKAEKGQAERSGEGVVRVSLPPAAIHLARSTKKAK